MIALVLVCHSAKLAEGAAELAAQVGGGGVRIGVAGGLDQPGGALGTDALRVVRSIEDVWSDDGVLVLTDLGSAVLSAEMAVDLLPEDRRGRVVLTEAPLVEGAVAAAVAAGLGDSLEAAAAEACGALAAKAAQLSLRPVPAPEGGAPPTAAGAPPPAGVGRTLRVTVENRLGLHARPVAALVRTAAAFDADVTVTDVTNRSDPASARSLIALASLGVRHGDEIEIRACGPQAEDALAAIESLVAAGFGDPPESRTSTSRAAGATGRVAAVAAAGPTAAAGEPPPRPGSVLQGLGGAPGIAVGPARRLVHAAGEVPATASTDRAVDWTALQGALAAAADDIRRARDSVAAKAGEYDAAIFDAHLLLLEDETLVGAARESILTDGANAARAWADAVAAAAATWEAVADPYLRARAADVRSVGDQVLRRLPGGGPEVAASGSAGGARGQADAGGAGARPAAGILVAADVTPAETAALDTAAVHGVACAFGGPTSHSAILARSLGLPLVVGLGPALLGVADGTPLVLDGDAGTVVVDPPAASVKAAARRRARRERDEAEARAQAASPAVTRDGVPVQVAANIAAAHEAAEAVAVGADAVGLLRTEFLFVEADHLPSEDEQEAAYRAAAEGLGGRRLTVRTLDVGADKQLPFLRVEREDNPALGLRGIRLGLARPEVLASQARAALRVAAENPVRLLFPMVATVDEVGRARAIVDEARGSLVAAGVAVPTRIEIGIMVEIPAVALLAEEFVPHVDFFSLGTNDLAQYALAADRGNAGVAALADALHPAVLWLIGRVARAAAESGRGIDVCGEVAGDPLAIPLLLGLGITALSMAPARIAAAKQAVRATDVAEAGKLAAEALAAGSAAEVRRLCARPTASARRRRTPSPPTR